MSFTAIVEIINFFLALTAALASLGILKKVAGNLAASWRYSFVAFLAIAGATLFAAIDGLGVIDNGAVSAQLLRNVAHFIFVILAFFGLLRQYQLIKGLMERGEE